MNRFGCHRSPSAANVAALVSAGAAFILYESKEFCDMATLQENPEQSFTFCPADVFFPIRNWGKDANLKTI